MPNFAKKMKNKMKFQSEYVSVLNNNYGGDVFRSKDDTPKK